MLYSIWRKVCQSNISDIIQKKMPACHKPAFSKGFTLNIIVSPADCLAEVVQESVCYWFV